MQRKILFWNSLAVVLQFRNERELSIFLERALNSRFKLVPELREGSWR